MLNDNFFKPMHRALITTAAIVVVGGNSIAIPSPAHAEPKYAARIGHLESALQPRHQGLERVAELVKARTNGDVEFTIYPSSQLGDQRQMTEGVQLGSIQGTVSPAAFLGGFNPAISILDIPFLYPEDRDQTQILRGGAFGQALLDTFDARGMVAVTLWPNGTKNFTSNKPLDTLAAFKGQRFRVMDSKILIEQFNALGASAIALPFGELYTSLQNGVVDGQENPLDTIQRMKFYEVQQHLVISGHGAMEDVVLFNKRWWNKLPAGYRQIITGAFNEVRSSVVSDKAAAQLEALNVIGKSGVSIRWLSDDERTRLRTLTFDKARSAYLERAGDEGAALMRLYEAEYEKL